MSKRLKFDDIDEWTPSSISIVDEPFHPLCKFEVYENDDEYVMKSIEVTDGEVMTEQNKIEEPEQMVSGPASFFKELFSRNVVKSDEVPSEEPEVKDNSEILAYLKKLDARITKLEEDKKPAEPVKEAVVKSEGETAEGEAGESEVTEPTEPAEDEKDDKVIDEEEVVSKSIDPDLVKTNTSTETKSLVERAGRKSNGMSW